jgi:glucokinase-like ROK family protein
MKPIRSADHALMREMNIALILECLRRAAPLSRAELAQMTGLTKATVSSLVRELLEAGYVRESGLDAGTKGRPSIQLVLNAEIGCMIGAEFGVDFISAVLADFSARVLWRQHEAIAASDQNVILPRVIASIRAASDEAAALGRPVLGLGLGVAGLVNVATGTLLFGSSLGWTDVPLRRVLEAEFAFPVYVDNDANLAALGESYFGAARGYDYVLSVSCGVGLGGGIVLNGRILTGAAGLAGEVGHMTIDPDGPPCNCGSLGCWEMYANQGALFQRVKAAIEAGQASALQNAAQAGIEALTVSLVLEAAQHGDKVALAAWRETGWYLGLGLANLINALNPERVILGGSLSLAHEFLLPMVRDVVGQRALSWAQEAASIVVAAHGVDSCLMGGIATVYNQVLSQPIAAMPGRARGRPARAAPGRPGQPAGVGLSPTTAHGHPGMQPQQEAAELSRRGRAQPA